MQAANGRTDTAGDRISWDKSNEDAGKKKTIAENTIPYYKMFKFADRLDMILMGSGIVAALGTGTMLPLMTILFGKLLNAFGQHQDPALHTVVEAVSEVAVEFVYIGVAAGACAFLQVSCWICTGERQAARIRQIYLKTILGQDIAFFDTATTTGEIIARMAGDTILIQEAMGEKVGKFLQLLATFCGGFIVAFFKCWKLTLVMLSAFPLLVLAGGTMAMIRTKMSGLGDQSYAEAGSVVEQTLGSIRTVVSFTGEKKAITSYETKLQSGYKDTVKQGIIRGFGMGALYFIIFSSYALALWYGSRLIINEGYSGGTVMNVVFAVLAGGMSLGQILPALNAFSAGKVAAYKMFETIKRKPAINVSDLSGLVPEDIQGDIELRNVYFRYPARPDVQVFSGFSLQIPGGTTAALVGESGSGKSTVINLIQRFYDPQVGQVLIDGSNIKKFQLKWLRQKTGLVSQEPVLFATTIRENMAYGKEEATMEEIKAAAEIANAAKFINRMPQGYETMVGEHGTQLSGGQKQRIAIARAILKNPRILLLDEATSALDAESERAVQEALDRIMANRTTVVVAHRLSTVKNADMIAVVQQGSIVEKGTHSQLIENPSGAYSQLIRLQGVDRATEQNEANKPGNTLKEESSTRIHRKRASSLSSFSSSEQETDHHHHHHQDEQNTNTRKTISSLWCFHRKSVQELEDAESGEAAAQKDVSFRRLASLNKPELPIFVLGCIAAVINGGVFPVFGLLLSSIISSFFEPAQELRQDADFWSLMFVVLAAVCFVVGPVQNTCFAVVGGRLVKRVRALTFGKIVYQEIGWFDAHENSSGAVGARLSTDAANVRGIVGDVLSLACQNVATIAMGFAIAFASNWKLAFLVLALVPLLSLQGYIQMKSMKGFSADAKVMYEQASEVASGALGSIRTVASFCAEDKVMKLYNKKCSVPLKNGIRQGLISGTGYGFSNFVLYAAYALTFWVGSKMVQSGDTTFGKVYKVFFALTMTAVGVAQTSSLIPDLSKVKASVNSVFKILDRRSKIDASDASGTTLATVRGDIEFRHISFRYPTRRNMQIFTDLNLIVSAGKTVALVGESGSGKSTVISLLQRFYDPESGHIYLDGVDISKLQVKWLRQQMGLVSQEPVLFNDTIYANIAYGKDGPISENEIINAAKASNAHKFISSLPQGYTTNVGERGLKLSGGQKQRIAIARAIAKNPRILLMDEATSALDAESERSVQDALDNIMVNRSTIVVAHRLSTIKNAHLIVVVKNGVIAEQGLHDSLVAEPHGHYAALVKMNSGS